MIEFSLVRSISLLKMLKYVSIPLVSRMILWHVGFCFAWFFILILFLLLLFVVVSEKQTKKKPRFGALPLLNMPKKSHETAKPPPRSYRSVVKDLLPSSSSVYYKTFSELCQRVEGLKSLSEWSCKIFPERLVIRKQDEHFQLPKVEIIIDNSLGFTVKAFGSFLVEDHDLYLKYKRSMQNITVSLLVNELKSYTLCGGVNPTEITSKLFHHVR